MVSRQEIESKWHCADDVCNTKQGNKRLAECGAITIRVSHLGLINVHNLALKLVLLNKSRKTSRLGEQTRKKGDRLYHNTLLWSDRNIKAVFLDCTRTHATLQGSARLNSSSTHQATPHSGSDPDRVLGILIAWMLAMSLYRLVQSCTLLILSPVDCCRCWAQLLQQGSLSAFPFLNLISLG